MGWGPGYTDFWKVHPDYAWADATHPRPLVVFPSHLTRLRDRVTWELDHNPQAAAVVVLVTVPRDALDRSSDWSSFSAAADAALMQGWNPNIGVSAVLGFAQPPMLRVCPTSSPLVPPEKWEGCLLPLKQAAVALTVTRRPADAPVPTFSKVGSHTSWQELQAADRAGLVRIALEVDLVQRPQPGRRGDAGSFCRRALRDLLSWGASSPPALVPPVQGLAQRGDMLCGFVDLPSAMGAHALRSSGAVRGIFARPWMSTDPRFPLPAGFTSSSHRVVWLRVERFSEVVAAALRSAAVAFDGLVCPRKRGEVGVRVPVASDLKNLQACVDSVLSGRMRSRVGGGRTRLRASGVPLALLDRLHLVVARINPDLRVVEQRVVRTTYDSLVADITVEGEVNSAAEWHLQGLGCRAVVVRRLSSTRPVPPTVHLQPRAQVSPLRRPLSAEARTSWASVAAKLPPSQTAAGATPPASSLTNMVTGTSAATAPSASPGLDDEIPVRSTRKSAKPSAKPPPTPPSATAPRSGIQLYMRKPTPAAQISVASPSSATPVASSVAAPSSSLSAATSSSAAVIDADRFNALVAQVENLTRSLAEQMQANQLLQEKLNTVLGECAALRTRLRAAKTKRSHSAAAAGKEELSGSDAVMSSAEEDSAPRRRSPGRDSPASV